MMEENSGNLFDGVKMQREYITNYINGIGAICLYIVGIVWFQKKIDHYRCKILKLDPKKL